jgi:hypothetical protein
VNRKVAKIAQSAKSQSAECKSQNTNLEIQENGIMGNKKEQNIGTTSSFIGLTIGFSWYSNTPILHCSIAPTDSVEGRSLDEASSFL